MQETSVKYMIMIHNDPEVWNALPRSEHEAVWSEGARKWQELVDSGEIIMGEPLAPTSEARNVLVKDGTAVITDGPFAESREQFVGFLLVEVASEERAVEIAASWPDARYAHLEVRRIQVANATE
jgi:hypothetical protein